MGIGITSNAISDPIWGGDNFVSIPNGDRHYLERSGGSMCRLHYGVSIPNGDRHYLEQLTDLDALDLSHVSIPNGDRHYLEQYGIGSG